MNRSEFIIATAIVLFIAFLLGWFAYWLLHRFSRSAGADMNEVERMARELHEAEEVRDQAIAYYQARESELVNRLQQAEAELRATMDGLREARAEAEGLKDYVESQRDEPTAFATARVALALTDADAEHDEQVQAEEPEPVAEPEYVPEPEPEPKPMPEPEPVPEPKPAVVEAEPEAEPEPEDEAAQDDAEDDAEPSEDAPKRRRRAKASDA